jgi:hypothetical protein
LCWHVHLLGYGRLALLDGALHVDVLDLLAQVRSGAEKLDQAVLDLKADICSLVDFFLECADCFDGEGLAAMGRSARAQDDSKRTAGDVRKRWVRREVNMLDGQ